MSELLPKQIDNVERSQALYTQPVLPVRLTALSTWPGNRGQSSICPHHLHEVANDIMHTQEELHFTNSIVASSRTAIGNGNGQQQHLQQTGAICDSDVEHEQNRPIHTNPRCGDDHYEVLAKAQVSFALPPVSEIRAAISQHGLRLIGKDCRGWHILEVDANDAHTVYELTIDGKYLSLVSQTYTMRVYVDPAPAAPDEWEIAQGERLLVHSPLQPAPTAS